MNKELWFPTPIWFDHLEFDREEVKQECLKLKELDPEGRVFSNLGGWQSHNIHTSDSPVFKNFFEVVINKCQEVFKDIDENFDAVIDGAWVNINKPNDFNRMHVHPWSTLSGCVYIDVEEESGNLVFHSPTPQTHYLFDAPDSAMFFNHAWYKPINNRIIVFPSWIQHEAFPSPKAKGERISIAFNMLQTKFLKN